MAVQISFRGVLLDQSTIDALLLAERLLGYPLQIMQGSWSNASASAGTHSGGGALDASVKDDSGNLVADAEQVRRVQALRRAGFAAWRRTPSEGFVYHVHCILLGDPLVSASAAQQEDQWHQGLDGLAAQGPDNDPVDTAAGRPAVLSPGAHVPRTMYDAVSVPNVPAGAVLVAGYDDGYYNNTAAFHARFPNATVVPITVFASDDKGTVLDVETGDATPAQAPGWVQMRRAAGVDPTVYCNTSTWPAVRAAFAAAGVAPPHYWVAQYDGDPTIPAGAVAKQYSDPGPYDLSSVADFWPGVDQGAVDVPLTPAEIDAVGTNAANKVIALLQTPAVRDSLAFAPAYWDLRGEDPSIALPTGPNLPGVVGVTAARQKLTAARQAKVDALLKELTALSAELATLGTDLEAKVEAAVTALPAAIQAALAAALVHVDVTVTGPVPPAP